MPLLLAVGHLTRDEGPGGAVLGGTAAYAALAARRLGWDAAVRTSCGPDLDPERELPGVRVFASRAAATTRFRNRYDEDGFRSQELLARAGALDLGLLPDELRHPEALLLGPVAGEIPSAFAPCFEAGRVGATAQGWLREADASGRVSPRWWAEPAAVLAGVHVLFLSEHDLPPEAPPVDRLLRHVPMLALTRGSKGLDLLTPEATRRIPSLPCAEVDPTGAGDVFAAAFLVRYHEAGDPAGAAAFAACAASCAVEGPGTSTLGDRSEVERRLGIRERISEAGEWDE
jgi:sugar/nucleoside kinase (ribokinase family)